MALSSLRLAHSLPLIWEGNVRLYASISWFYKAVLEICDVKEILSCSSSLSSDKRENNQ